jgi:hypothetical protein
MGVSQRVGEEVLALVRGQIDLGESLACLAAEAPLAETPRLASAKDDLLKQRAAANWW